MEGLLLLKTIFSDFLFGFVSWLLSWFFPIPSVDFPFIEISLWVGLWGWFCLFVLLLLSISNVNLLGTIAISGEEEPHITIKKIY